VGAAKGPDIGEVAAVAQIVQETAVGRLERRPVGAVHVGIVEVVPIDPPGLVEDLRPFLAGLDTDAQAGRVERLGLDVIADPGDGKDWNDRLRDEVAA